MGPGFRMGRRRGLIVGAAVGAHVANKNKQQNDASQDSNEPVDAPAASSDTNQQLAELEKLGQLKDQGVLTQEEFDAKKKQILGL
jgi:hypothetical protein